MHRTPILCVVLASWLLVSSCASSSPASLPVVQVAPTPAEIADGVAETDYHGIPGLFFTFEAWKNVLINFRLKTKDIELALSNTTVALTISEGENALLKKSATAMQWRATYGLPLGIGIGSTAAAVITAILIAALNGAKNGQ